MQIFRGQISTIAAHQLLIIQLHSAILYAGQTLSIQQYLYAAHSDPRFKSKATEQQAVGLGDQQSGSARVYASQWPHSV